MEKIKQKFKDLFTRNPRFELIELDNIDVSEDPVRPELTVEFRKQYGSSVEEMDLMSQDAANQAVLRAGLVGRIAVAYTVWARKKGGGKHILNEVYKKYKGEHHIDRLVTLSPLTEMAERFHIKNGAKLLRRNDTTQNFEYDITLEQWREYLTRTKKFLRMA
jgi:hypothetical protein